MLAELPEKDGPGSFKKAVNFVKNKCKKDSSSERAPNFKISSKPKSADAKECKEIAFHHAGYDPDSHNTVMFRLKGSKSYTGGVRGSTVIMMLFILLGQEGLESLHFALRRGKDFIHVHRNTILKKSDYYVHRIDPDNPADLFYRYPLVPCFRLWTMPKIMIDLWTCDGRKSIVETRNQIDVHKPDEQQLRYSCDKAVIARDKRCVLTNWEAKYCDRAYLTPTSETEFWKEEKMGMHMGGKSF
jgi:hypothetical protein